jgi:formylglycine-generating enzyme required for sulfatase activity
MAFVRVFVSSPGDCSDERALVEEVARRINLESERTGLFLQTFAWENDVVPRIGPPPQKVVDDQTPICDVFVGIMSSRFGGDESRESGTELEFRQALKRFGDTGLPWILFYFNDQPPRATTSKDADDLARVLRFKEELERKGLVGTYADARGNPHGFFETLELHLRGILQRPEFARQRRSASQRKTSPRAPARRRRGAARSTVRLDVPKAYLDWMKAETGGQELLPLGPQERAARVRSVYVPLLTSATLVTEKKDAKSDQKQEAPEADRLLLHKLAARSLYVSGVPGSGKSTFCRWVAWLVANGAMPESDIAPPPPFIESLPPSLCGKLAVWVPLREFSDALPHRTGRSLTANELAATITTWLRETTETARDIDVLRFLDAGRALLLFDGVDEVPTSGAASGSGGSNPRQLLLSGLSRLVERWVPKGNTLLVTSRPHGLTDAEVARLGLDSSPIDDLPAGLQRHLARRWFRIEQEDAKSADASASRLMLDIGGRQWLQPLAANPLMLTAMCAIYRDGQKLPEDRHELYERIVDGMLTKRYSDPAERAAVRAALCAVAHAMHVGVHGRDRVEPLRLASYGEAEIALRKNKQGRQSATAVDASQMLIDLLARSGLLVARANRTVDFNHSSIQEFLAAQRLFDSKYANLAPVFASHARAPGWRNTLWFLFARYAATFALSSEPLDLLRSLIESLDDSALMPQLVVAECAEMLLAKGYVLQQAPARQLRERLLRSMNNRPARRERCDAGLMLGKIGDPRFDAGRWFLPVEPQWVLGFVRVPAGPFLMGSDPSHDKLAYQDEQPQHTIDLPEYFVGRYPVTVAQFRAYVEDSGVALERADCLNAVANHPVVFVSWYEALNYCRWLTRKLRGWAKAPPDVAAWLDATIKDGWEITLPSEPEWEKAARGADRRIYPWGEKFDHERANESIGDPSAVGAFPQGASPFDVMDLSGNVWEWTRSLWGPLSWTPKFGYPYDGQRTERENIEAPDTTCRVARGGSFDYPVRSCRAANRSKGLPRYTYRNTGFRLAVTRAIL